MKRNLLEENLPFGLGKLLDGEVRHVTELGWDGASNGTLIEAAEHAGFHVMVTADKNLRYQQNVAVRELALVVLGTSHWDTVRRNAGRIAAAIERSQPGSFVELDFGPEHLRRRSRFPRKGP